MGKQGDPVRRAHDARRRRLARLWRRVEGLYAGALDAEDEDRVADIRNLIELCHTAVPGGTESIGATAERLRAEDAKVRERRRAYEERNPRVAYSERRRS